MQQDALLREASRQLGECGGGTAACSMTSAPECGAGCVHLAVTTLEGARLPLRFSAQGVDVVQPPCDDNAPPTAQFDSVHSALMRHSPGYARWYLAAVAARLSAAAAAADGAGDTETD